MHQFAQKAAEAAHCAGDQSRYWEYHDALLANRALDLGSLKRYARDLKLDTAAFDTCLDKGQQAGTVKTNLTEAQNLGLQGTPTIFINGRYISGELTYERLRGVIAEELSAIEMSGSSAAASSPRNQ
jgi:protein-disulfide isomerase